MLAEDRLHLPDELTDLEHVHVVVVPGLRIRAQVKVLVDDLLDLAPVGTNVARCAPGLRDVRGPSSWKRPAADVEPDISPARRLDRICDLGVADLLVEL